MTLRLIIDRKSVVNVQVAIQVLAQSESKQAQVVPAKRPTLSQDEYNEIAEIKKHAAKVQFEKMNPPVVMPPPQPNAPTISQRRMVQTVSRKGEGPFESDQSEVFFGWDVHKCEGIAIAYISQIYQFKGKDRYSDRGDAFSAFREANELNFGTHATYNGEHDSEYETMEEARKNWTKRIEQLAKNYKVTVTEHVWK